MDSYNFNLHKWMLMNFDCSAMWLRNADHVVDSFNVDRIYLKHKYQGKTKVPDFRHWQVQLGRKFRALKVWIVLRTMGVEKIQGYIRGHIALAQKFAKLVREDDRFEVEIEPCMGLVCFRMRGDCQLTKTLLERLTEQKKIYMIPAIVHEKFVIRFVICGMDAQEKDIDYAWQQITEMAANVLKPVKDVVDDVAEKIKTIETLNDRITTGLNISFGNEKVQ